MKNFLCRLWTLSLQPRALPWLALATGFWLGCLSWLRPLHLPDEGRYVGVAWDMTRFDSPWVPLMNGLPYFHKPPLFYWLDEWSFALLGVHEWSARLPSWVAAWSTAIGLYLFVRKYRGAEVATVTLLVLVTMPLFYGASQYANLDMLVAGMMSLTVLAGAEAVLRSESGQAYRAMTLAAAACAGLAILSKGLIGVVLPGGVLFFWLVLTGRWRKIGVFLWLPAVALFLLVTVPWFVAMQWRYPEFFHYYFIVQQYERFVGESFNNTQPLWFYLPVIFGMSLPWSAWTLGLLSPAFWKSDAGKTSVLMLIWFLLIAVFFSIPASKLIGYAVPTLPPLAVLAAEVIVRAMGGKWSVHVVRTLSISFVAVVIACLAGIGVFRFIQSDSARGMGALVAAQGTPDDIFIYSHSFPFDLAFYSGARHPAWVVDDWPAIPVGDNWRNELLDATRFSPALGKEVMVSFTELIPRMCQTTDRGFWLRGDQWEAGRWSFLEGLAPVLQQADDGRLWRVKTDAAFKARFCPA